MEKYSKYILSKFTWLGEIPEHWVITKNRYGFKKSNNGSNESDSTPVLSLTTKGVKIKQNLDFGKSSESYIGHQLVEVGDIVFTPRDFDQTPILSDVSKYSGCISNLYIVDKTKENVLNYFVNYYWYGLKYSVNYFKNFSHGMRFSFNRFQFDEIPLLIPPLHEQHQIVDFLDSKTELIDKLISNKERKITLLKEQRTSLINQVITKGLNPNVKLKDSGVKCIGEIPEHWEIIRLKDEYKIQKGRIPKLIFEQYDDTLIPYLSMDILRGSDKYFFTSKEDGVFVRNGQILILWDGSNSGEILKVNHDGILSSTMSVMNNINNKIIDELTFYQMKIFETDIRNNTNGMGIPHVDGQYIRGIKLFRPPLHEQHQIIEFLDSKINEIEDLVSSEQTKIDLLKEYRQSLISEVVTGKIKVTI